MALGSIRGTKDFVLWVVEREEGGIQSGRMCCWCWEGTRGQGWTRDRQEASLGYALSSRLRWEGPMDRPMDCCWMDGSTVGESGDSAYGRW